MIDVDEFNPKSHKSLLEAISAIGKTQHIRKSTRDEAQKQQSEFHLVKGSHSSAGLARALPVGINEIVKILKTTKKHIDAGKQLKNVQSTKKVLRKPLEKPAAARIKRTVGYEGVKQKLSRWDAVVTQNRAAETQVFPLQSETIYVDTAAHAKPLQLSLRSELALEMAATDAKLKFLKKELSGENEEAEKATEQRQMELLKTKLTRDELLSKRRELANLKMRESQKSAKARMQNKIKSKKYHKLLKRQKMQEKIKDFELLQKTNPEVALEKLNELEKSRVLERANLRHKNTGTWAKNLQIRAKYDKDVRKDLAEQLQISRNLTEKKNNEEDSDEDEDVKEQVENEGLSDEAVNDPFNPWTTMGTKTSKANETNDDVNWRKYWLKRNKNEKLREEYEKEDEGENIECKTTDSNQIGAEKHKTVSKKAIRTKLTKKKVIIENGWLVEELPTQAAEKNGGRNIDDIFDAQEDLINRKLHNQLKLISKKAKHLNKAEKKTKVPKKVKDELKALRDLTFKTEAKRPIINEELDYEETSQITNQTISKIASTVPARNSIASVTNEKRDTIDPNNVAMIKLKQHASTLNYLNDAIDDDAVMHDVGEEDAAYLEQQLTISEAFKDDDIIADFSKEKTKDSKLKNDEIQLSMPGWGSWAGAGISEEHSANKNQRLILKLANKVEKRRDENKTGVYINEVANKKLREHLVSDVPFPFTSLQDYEASIRAPVGRNFVPETAFRMLNRPAVITRKGAVIEPMDESELVKQPRKLRHVVDRRIQRAAAATAGAK